jgi:hypothetical protein
MVVGVVKVNQGRRGQGCGGDLVFFSLPRADLRSAPLHLQPVGKVKGHTLTFGFTMHYGSTNLDGASIQAT